MKFFLVESAVRVWFNYIGRLTMAQKTKITLQILSVFMAMLLGNIGSVAFAHNPPVNLSGYDTFIGLD